MKILVQSLENKKPLRNILKAPILYMKISNLLRGYELFLVVSLLQVLDINNLQFHFE